METTKFINAKRAYDAGDFSAALAGFLECMRDEQDRLEPGDRGNIYHLMGNCLVKMKRYDKAIPTYERALDDAAYLKRSSLQVNLGMAYIATRDYETAISCFDLAVADPSYPSSYKAYNGKGNALLKLGRPADAGIAYRKAALEEGNPDPARSLVNLGVCFMALNRPHDAVEAYVTALEFDTQSASRNKTYANLGQAYVATGRMHEALDAFNLAMEDGTYQLNEAARVDRDRALKSQTFDQNPEAGLDVLYDDARYDTRVPNAHDMRQREEECQQERPFEDYRMIPPADDTGFFTVSEEEIDARGKSQMKKARKLRNIGLKILLVFAIILLLLLGAGAFAYYKGYGYPLQETVIQDMFTAYANDKSIEPYWAEASSDELARAMSTVGKTSNIKIEAVTREMTESQAVVTATLKEGGQLRYELELGRDGITWKITSIQLVFASTSS